MTSVNINKTIIVVSLLASVYFISQFLRSALGITVLSISQDFELNYKQIGMLGGVFFLSFALIQIPLGILLDKFNPLKIIILMLTVIYIGTIILSFANSYEQILFARLLQGVGCGACLMGPLVYLAKNMARKSFSKFSGIVMGFGGLGALFAFNPFYLMTLQIGWRNSFFSFSFLIAIICFTLVLLLKLKKRKNSSQKKNDSLHTFIFIFTNKNFLKMLPMSIFGYASFASLLTLWGSKFLSIKQIISDNDISIILMSMALFWTLGSFFFGYINGKLNIGKKLVIISCLILVVFLFLLAFVNLKNYFLIITLFSAYGFLGAFTLIILDHYRRLFSNDIIGKVLTSANLFNFGGVFFIQWLIGAVIDFVTEKKGFTEEQGFSLAFMLIATSLILSLLFYISTDEENS